MSVATPLIDTDLSRSYLQPLLDGDRDSSQSRERMFQKTTLSCLRVSDLHGRLLLRAKLNDAFEPPLTPTLNHSRCSHRFGWRDGSRRRGAANRLRRAQRPMQQAS